MVRTIVSGGQTGVDRAALEFAREAGLRVEGFCPAGYWAEDGSVPEQLRAGLRPTQERDPAVRTRLNVELADATLVVVRRAPVGGTALAVECCRALGRPLLIVSPDEWDAGDRIHRWIASARPSSLNVAGPRESEEPGIAEAALGLLRDALGVKGPG